MAYPIVFYSVLVVFSATSIYVSLKKIKPVIEKTSIRFVLRSYLGVLIFLTGVLLLSTHLVSSYFIEETSFVFLGLFPSAIYVLVKVYSKVRRIESESLSRIAYHLLNLNKYFLYLLVAMCLGVSFLISANGFVISIIVGLAAFSFIWDVYLIYKISVYWSSKKVNTFEGFALMIIFIFLFLSLLFIPFGASYVVSTMNLNDSTSQMFLNDMVLIIFLAILYLSYKAQGGRNLWST